MSKVLKILFFLLLLLSLTSVCFASDNVSNTTLDDVVNVQKYFRSIHIMAMLMVGFGFLMVFVKKYGRTALTATYLMVSIAIPTYFLITYTGIFDHHPSQIDKLIFAEFSAAALLIAGGAILGRLKLYQYIILGILFIPFYMLNEWVVSSGIFSMLPKGHLVDTGGSIVIHAFGAIFGLGLIFSLTSKKAFSAEIQADATSDRFSLLGSMILWVFWPSFCAALVAPQDLILTVVNVVMALSGSTLAAYFASMALRKKASPADIANATLAGGVAIGSTCDVTIAPIAFLIGLLAGVISTFGFAVIQGKLQKAIKKIDTCGVLYLHGLPGIFGGLVALFVVKGIDIKAQLTAIILTIVIALVSGLIVGKIVSFTGNRIAAYTDDEELETE